MSISDVMRGASSVNDADTAKVFAEVLNNDLLAIKKLGGRDKFETEDALRVSRILGEYQRMDGTKGMTSKFAVAPTARAAV